MVSIYLFGVFVVCAALGSFAAASVWRLRAQQLVSDQKEGEKLTKSEQRELTELKKIHGKKTASDRSICLHCGRHLQIIDLIPVVSWLALRGKCRTCKKPIGWMEFLAEVGLGVAGVVSYLVWPYGFASWQESILFVLWLLILTCLAIHLMYDAKWFLLLDKITIIVAFLAVLYTSVTIILGISHQSFVGGLMNIGLALLILPGFYGLLYLISSGKWIGFGDVKLLIPLAIMLPTWQHAFLMLFVANLLGSLVMVPGMMTGAVKRTTRVPFGPFLIVGWLIVMLWGTSLIGVYTHSLMF